MTKNDFYAAFSDELHLKGGEVLELSDEQIAQLTRPTEQDTIVIHRNSIRLASRGGDAAVGRLILALFAFLENGETPEFADDDSSLGAAWQQASEQLKSDVLKYRVSIIRSRIKGLKGGMGKHR